VSSGTLPARRKYEMKIPGLHDKHCDGVMLSIYPVFFKLLRLLRVDPQFHCVLLSNIGSSGMGSLNQHASTGNCLFPVHFPLQKRGGTSA
jgi:hypothetical protein